MKRIRKNFLEIGLNTILTAAMFCSLGINAVAEDEGTPAATDAPAEVTETVEAPLPEPEPEPEVVEETPAAEETVESAVEETAAPAQETAAAEVTAVPQESAAPTPEVTAAPAEETPAAPEETAEAAKPEETAAPEETAEPEPTAEATAETVTYMPAGTFVKSTSQMTVTVSYDGHTFKDGTTMRVSDVSRSEALAAAEQGTEGDEEVIDAVAVDITFLSADGTEVQPEGAVSVSMVPNTPLETTATSTTEVIHKDDNGNTETVSADVSANGADFSAEHFSIYVISSKDNPAIATYIFHDADGNEISTQKVKSGETVYAPTTPEKSGYKFLGWSYTQNATALQAGDPGDVSTITASVSSTGDVNLYPVFQQVYYVFFLDNQGRVSTTKEGVTNDTISVSDVKIPLDSANSVTGWYTDPGFTNKVDSVTLSDHNVTLYPKVEAGHYLYFASGEGADYIEPEFVAATEGTKAPETPSRPGYTFRYWSATEGGSEYTFGSTISEDATLYAVWTADKNTSYTVIYWWENANDDNYSFHESETRTGESGSTVSISGVAKSYEGFTLNADKTNAANSSTTIAGDGSTLVNIYYVRKQYSVRFYYVTVTYPWWDLRHRHPEYSWQEYTDLRITAKYGANISDKWPSSISSIWGTKQGETGGESPYQSGISVMPLNGASFYYAEQSGQYTINSNYYTEGLDGKYHLHHTDSSKSDGNRWTTTPEDHYDIEGFTYTNNVKDGSKYQRVGGSNTYEANFKYSRNSYTINFINGGTTTSQTYKYEADLSSVTLPANPEKPSGVPDGYVFSGWYDNELGAGDPAALPSTMPAHNITLYAKWAAPTYQGTIHLSIDGAKTPITYAITYGTTINENEMPTVKDAEGNVIQQGSGEEVIVPKGYKWVGWATKNDDSFIVFNFNTKVFGAITLYPYYTNTEQYFVTYANGEGGSGTLPTDSKAYAENSYADIQYAYGITPPDGKTFLYWSDGSNHYYPGDKVKITGNLTLTAAFGDTPETTSIIYHSNYPAGSELADTSTLVDGQANNTAITLEKAGFAAPKGYYFVEWQDAAGTKYPVGTKIGIDNTSENHLYAVWEKKQEITVTAKDASKMYDGTALTLNDFTVIGLSKEYTADVTVSGSITDVGTTENKVTSVVIRKGNEDVTDKFSVTAKNGTLTITKRKVTLTSESASKEYDGTALTKPDVTVGGNGFVNGEVSDIKATGTITNVGTKFNAITFTKNSGFKEGNYEITEKPGTLTITNNAAEIKVTAGSATKTYDGTALTEKNYSITGLPEKFTAEVGVSGTITDAGTENNTISSVVIKLGDENVTEQFSNIQKATGTLTVNKRTVNLKSESASKTYDGTALTRPDVTVTGDGFVDGEVSDIKATGSIITAGSVTNTIEYTENTGFKKDNYSITKDEGTLTITQHEGEIVVTAKNAEKTYDGTALTENNADVSGVPEGYTADVTVSGMITDAGTTENVVTGVVIKNGSGNDVTDQFKNITKNNGTLTITRRSVTLTSSSVTREYNGTELTAPDVTVTGDGFVQGEVSDIKATGAITEVGSVENSITYTGTGAFKESNYDISVKPGTLTITKNTALIHVIAEKAEKLYDGTELTGTYKITGLPEGFTAAITLRGSITNAGSVDNVVESVSIQKNGEDVTSQFSNIVTEKGTLTVTKRTVNLKSENASKTYDGTALIREDVTVTGDGFVKGEVSDIKAVGTITKAGHTLNTITYSVDKDKFNENNYNITKDEGTLTITKRSVNLVSETANKIYDGTPLTKPEVEITGDGFVKGEVNDIKAVGTITNVEDNPVTNTVTYKSGTGFDPENYTINITEGKLTISKRKVTLTSESASKTYDGMALTKEEVTADGDGFVSGEGATYSSFASITNVAESPADNTFEYQLNEGTKAENYEITRSYGTLTITQADPIVITITGNTAETVYDGKEHTVSGVTVEGGTVTTGSAKKAFSNFFTSLANRMSVLVTNVQAEETGTDGNGLITVKNLPAGITVSLAQNVKAEASGTDAGEYTMGLTENSFIITGTDNYQGVTVNVIDGKLTITRAPLTVKTENAEKVYDGKPLTAGGSLSGIVNSETLTFKATGSQTNVGSSDNTYSITWDGSAKETNYTVSATLGKLTVKARPSSDESKSSSGSSTTTFFPTTSATHFVPRTSAEGSVEE